MCIDGLYIYIGLKCKNTQLSQLSITERGMATPDRSRYNPNSLVPMTDFGEMHNIDLYLQPFTGCPCCYKMCLYSVNKIWVNTSQE